MVTLHVALHDGFVDDEVEIRVDGQVVWADTGVRTRTQISLADSVEVDVPTGAHDIDVRALSRGTDGRIRLDVRQPAWLAASLDSDGSVVLRSSSEPFRYA